MYYDLKENELSDLYDEMMCEYLVIISKIKANSIHGLKYGLKQFIIDDDDENEFDFEKEDKLINTEYYRSKIIKLESNLRFLTGVLEEQRMYFLVKSFCSVGQSNSFPSYVKPLIKSKYPKLYMYLLCCGKNTQSIEGEGGHYFEEDGYDVVNENEMLKKYNVGKIKVKFNI